MDDLTFNEVADFIHEYWHVSDRKKISLETQFETGDDENDLLEATEKRFWRKSSEPSWTRWEVQRFSLWWHVTRLMTRWPSLIERTIVCFLHWPHDGEPDDAMQHDVVGGRQRLSEDFNQPC